MSKTEIILASASPRRKELLAQIGLTFQVKVSHVEETVTKTAPADVVLELSAQKAEAVLQGLCTDEKEFLVIGADTVVACGMQILGKPGDCKDAVKMLTMLQGAEHEVYTGVTLLHSVPGKPTERKAFYEVTGVTFYPMTEEEIKTYAATGDPMDKAGAYGIQGICARYIKGITGDYNNVVGLPVGRLYQEAACWLGEDELSMKKAVIFDLDGTLSDSIQSMKKCTDEALSPYGFGPFSVEQYRYFVGDGAENLIRRALAAGGDTRGVHLKEAFARYKELFRTGCMYGVKPYDGILELLDALKEKKVALAVLSNKPHAETVHVIETLFGREYFAVIRGQKDNVPIKPDPEGVFLILEELGISTSDALYLGDTSTDMQTGKNAGVFTVGALWGFRDRKELEENHADAVIESPAQLLDYL